MIFLLQARKFDLQCFDAGSQVLKDPSQPTQGNLASQPTQGNLCFHARSSTEARSDTARSDTESSYRRPCQVGTLPSDRQYLVASGGEASASRIDASGFYMMPGSRSYVPMPTVPMPTGNPYNRGSQGFSSSYHGTRTPMIQKAGVGGNPPYFSPARPTAAGGSDGKGGNEGDSQRAGADAFGEDGHDKDGLDKTDHGHDKTDSQEDYGDGNEAGSNPGADDGGAKT